MILNNSCLLQLVGLVSQKSRNVFGPEKPFVKLRPAYSVKLVFSYVVKGIKIKITATFRASRRLHCEDTKRNMSPWPEMRPKSPGTFEKRAPGAYRRLYGSIVDSIQLVLVITLRNRTAGRLRTAEWRKNVPRDWEFPILRDSFSSFCRPESSSRPVA